MWYDVKDGTLYQGDMQPGDRAATEEEIAARNRELTIQTCPKVITRSQAALEMWNRKMITAEECRAMVKSGDLPKMFADLFDKMVTDQLITAEDRIIIDVQFARDSYDYYNPLLRQVVAAISEGDELALVAFFTSAAQR